MWCKSTSRRAGRSATRRPTRSARFGFASGPALIQAAGALGLCVGITATAGADPIIGNATALSADADPVVTPATPKSGSVVPTGGDAGADAPMPMPMPTGVDPTTGLSLSIGGSSWGGDFGAPTDSRVDVIFANARYRQGDLRLNATLPWMRIRSDGTIYTGIDGSPLIVAPFGTGGRRKRHGLADVTLGANWLALDEDRVGADVELSGRVKLPTASDSSGLSTGKVDYSVAAEVSRSIGAVTPSVRLGYRFLTDFDGIDLRNGFASSIGASAVLFKASVLLVSYDFTERATRFIRDAHEVALGLSTPLGDRFRLNSYGSIGLSSGAADLSAGLSLTVGFGR